jgi:hypothetical protein
MPQKRPKNSRNALLVTPASVELYRTGLRTKPCYDACRAAVTIDCEHPDCKTFYATFHALNMAFNILPHQPSPLNSYADIEGRSDVYPPGSGGRDNARVLLIKKALDAACKAEIEPDAGEDRNDD